MASKYCDQHQIWYDYREGCPECMKVPKFIAGAVSTVIAGAIGGLIWGGRKIHERIKESKNQSISDGKFCAQCGSSLSEGTKFCSQCGAKI